MKPEGGVGMLRIAGPSYALLMAFMLAAASVFAIFEDWLGCAVACCGFVVLGGFLALVAYCANAADPVGEAPEGLEGK